MLAKAATIPGARAVLAAVDMHRLRPIAHGTAVQTGTDTIRLAKEATASSTDVTGRLPPPRQRPVFISARPSPVIGLPGLPLSAAS